MHEKYSAQIAGEIRGRGPQMCGEGGKNASTLDAESAFGFRGLVGGHLVEGPVGAVDGGGFDLEAELAQLRDLAQHKDHGEGRVGADQIGERAGR